MSPDLPSAELRPASVRTRATRLACQRGGLGVFGLLGLAVMLACGGPEPAQPPPPTPTPVAAAAVGEDYFRSVEQWRERRLSQLRSDHGWLTLAGLFWLPEGASSFGSDGANRIRFPAGFPARAGVFHRQGKAVSVEVEPGVAITVDGRAITTAELRSDVDDQPTVLRFGTFSFFTIERGTEDVGVRLKDSASPVLRAFTTVDSFPVDARWRVAGSFEPYLPPRTITVPTAYGTTTDEVCGGAVVFQLAGEEQRLDAIVDEGGDLFLIFADPSNEVSTYGGGRFLYADAPAGTGSVILDFNMSVNPPCAFTPYATCPLPPHQNRLTVAVEAGEKRYGEGHH